MKGGFHMNRIMELRKKLGYSQQELANILFVNQTAVSQWERNATTPSPNILIKLCELFYTTTDYLLGRTDDPASLSEKKAPASAEADDSSIKFALFGDTEIDDETFDEVKRYAQFIKDRKKSEPK